MLTEVQKEDIRRRYWRWLSAPAPCGISHADIYNPCLPEQDDRGLWCATCGLRQRLEIESGQVKDSSDERGLSA